MTPTYMYVEQVFQNTFRSIICSRVIARVKSLMVQLIFPEVILNKRTILARVIHTQLWMTHQRKIHSIRSMWNNFKKATLFVPRSNRKYPFTVCLGINTTLSGLSALSLSWLVSSILNFCFVTDKPCFLSSLALILSSFINCRVKQQDVQDKTDTCWKSEVSLLQYSN